MKKPRTHAQRLRQRRGGRARQDKAYDDEVRARDPKLAGAARTRGKQRWRVLSEKKRRHDPLCELCLKGGTTEPATQVDHIIPLTQRPDLAFVWSNLMSICNTCHASKSAAERRAT